MEKIEIRNIPVEPMIQILKPDGSVLISTNCMTTFDYIRAEIKDHALEGYKIRTKDGIEVEIDKHGRFFDKDDRLVGKIPGDTWMKIVERLL